MDRRSFLKCTTASILAAGLPNTKQANSPPTHTQNDAWRFSDEWEKLVKPTPPIRRFVLFVQEGVTPRIEVELFGSTKDAPVPPVGTLVASPDEKFLFTVVETEPVHDIIPYITGQWDVQNHGKKPGQHCGGVMMLVEAVAPGSEYKDCRIRKAVTPGLGYDHICEAHPRQLYHDPNFIVYYAHDAVYPPETQPESWRT